jgi:hypothetical protein
VWTLLRSAFLHATWVHRCGRLAASEMEDGSEPVVPSPLAAANQIVGHTVATIKACIRRDWLWVTEDPRMASAACSSWFRGQSPLMKEEEFSARWCELGNGALCAVRGGALVISLSVSMPVAVAELVAGP